MAKEESTVAATLSSRCGALWIDNLHTECPDHDLSQEPLRPGADPAPRLRRGGRHRSLCHEPGAGLDVGDCGRLHRPHRRVRLLPGLLRHWASRTQLVSGVQGGMSRAHSRLPHSDLEELVASAQGGDSIAMQRLLTECEPALRRLAQKVCPPGDASDAVQEVLWRVTSHIGALRMAAAFMTWSLRMVIRECQRLHRHAMR